jgi:hypothetical protein
MNITQQDLNEVSIVSALVNKIDAIDADYVDKISDEIFHMQPFFLTVLLGYRLDTTPIELEEIMRLYFLIWEYFRSNEKVQSRKITESCFEAFQLKNIEMLQYAEGEPGNTEKMEIYASDIDIIKSKALLAAAIFQLNNRPALVQMPENKRGMILIGLKSFIKCFETM